MQTRRTVVLADAKEDLNTVTGRMEWVVKSGSVLIAEFAPLGLQTYFTAGGATNIFREKIAVRTATFNREPYIYSDGKLYEFVTYQPYVMRGGSNSDMIWLIVNEIVNRDIIAAIEKWRDEQ